MIKVRNLHKYFGQLHVLRGVDLSVGSNEVVVLIGPSGSGKSTLLRCLNFLEEAQEGEIQLSGQVVDPKKDSLDKVRERVGMVFQHFNLFPHMTVMKNMAESGMTMIVVSHEMGFAREVADRVVMMDEGKIIEDASPQEMFENPGEERTRRFLSEVL